MSNTTTKTRTTKFSSEPAWLFRGAVLSSEEIEGYAGFVYRITDTRTGVFYIGKKLFFTNRIKTFKTGRKRRRVHAESDWKRYWSSCDELKELVLKDGPEHFVREVLYLCPSKRMMSYYETKVQFALNVLERTDCLNTNIAGKFFQMNESDLDNVVQGV